MEIAVSISPHSVATRSTDNKSSLILLKISRECSGGGDEDSRREREMWGGGGEEEEGELRLEASGQTREKERERAEWLANL